MGKFIFIFSAIIFFAGILNSTGVKRIIWFFTGILFFEDKIVLFEFPTLMNFHRFLIYTLLLAELLNVADFYQKLKEFPLIKPLGLVLIGLLCTAVFDGRNGLLLSVYRVVDMFVQTFFILFLCYANFKRNSEWRSLFNFFLIAAAGMCLFGFYVFLTKSNPYDDYISHLYGAISEFQQYALEVDERFRVNSFVSHPIYYGYLAGVLLLVLFCHFINRDKFRGIYLIVIALTFINLILTNSRTPLIATFAGLTVFTMITLNRKTFINVAIYFIFTCAAIYYIPFVQDRVDNSIDIFQTGGQKTSGSSLNMRMEQLNASIKEYKKSPVFGNGLYYIKENLGFVNIEKNKSNSDFKGFESYIYELLIEQGAVGILVNLIFFFSLGIYFFKNIRTSRPFAGLGFSIVTMFLIFIIGTGALGSWVITMGLLGILIGTLNYTRIFNKLMDTTIIDEDEEIPYNLNYKHFN